MKWMRVNKNCPCPICSHTDWCGVSDDGGMVICMRQEEGSTKLTRNDGYLHVLRKGDGSWQHQGRRVFVAEAKVVRDDLPQILEECGQALDDEKMGMLSNHLGVSAGSLRRLALGWHQVMQAWTFPMLDHACKPVGIRLRSLGGSKSSLTGSCEGLFIPTGLTYKGPLLITEGPTDCAAMLDLGFEAIGRPSCVGGVDKCIALVRESHPANVVVVADADAPGQKGAETLASALLLVNKSVQIICPPDGVKDARAWKRAGATREIIETAINSAPLMELTISSRRV